MKLSPDRFPEFFQAVYGYAPFPWQTRLLRQVLTDGWPSTISLPTASGKTAVMDVAVFAMACNALTPVGRPTPRRIAHIVDRRVVVDQSFRRAKQLAHALEHADSAVLREVGDALMSLGGEVPLDVAQLRGGMYREERWARTPAQPVILCSTVDQVGSRLLFRGYGISPAMRPIHAGLLGNDTLIVLDEAHCSEPFRQTLRQIAELRNVGTNVLNTPFAFVTMTATPREHEITFTLDSDDKANSDITQRIDARKMTKLEVAEGGKDSQLVSSILRQLRGDQDVGLAPMATAGRTILVVVNRVACARLLRDELAKLARKKGKDQFDVHSILLTGRCRSLERDTILESWGNRLMAGRDRAAHASDRSLIVVATQCVEVGADIDADALITECCSLDALRQRLGRLDRLGILGNSSVRIVIREDQVGEVDKPVDDPVYGTSLSETWHWLTRRVSLAGEKEGVTEEKGSDAEIDLGTAALADLTPDEVARLSMPQTDAPFLFPAYCDIWSQTNPEPALSPCPSIFLHGPETGIADVRIVWRGDILAGQEDTWKDTVALCPPVSEEALSLPLWLARQWLSGVKKIKDFAGDIEANREEEITGDGDVKPVLGWLGLDDSKVIKPSDIMPGETLVVPASYGGCDTEGWNPDSSSPVRDIADIARWRARRTAVLRLHPALYGDRNTNNGGATDNSLSAGWKQSLNRLAWDQPEEWTDQYLDDVWTELGKWNDKDAPDEIIGIVQKLLQGPSRSRQAHPHPSGVGLVLTSKRCTERPVFTDEDFASSENSTPITLVHHQDGVAAFLDQFLQSLGISGETEGDLRCAACNHDLGKADPRFQAWLSGGGRLHSLCGELLAKSTRSPGSNEANMRARHCSGYPKGARHELLSCRLLESFFPEIESPHDQELVLHLVASHHGYCRPFAPSVVDDRPLTVQIGPHSAGTDTGLERLDSGVAERFWRLTRRYGWWGLAFLEACVRLADHRASEKPNVVEEEKDE